MPTPVQQSLEAALVEDPDDLATHSAYADYLMEHGDPRCKFTRVQLLREAAGRPPAEQTQLRQREKELLRQHGRRWLGDAGRFLVGNWTGADKPTTISLPAAGSTRCACCPRPMPSSPPWH